jgi:predicted TIM-barrel fold metal-dependent hydrolase
VANQQPDRYLVVSADCHAGADLSTYKSYLPSEWHDEYDAWANYFSDPWEHEPHASLDQDLKPGPASFDSRLNWDGEHRREVLESEGIVAEVVFPNTAPPFFPGGILTVAIPQTRSDYERRLAGLRAHNRWLKDFCDELPGRRAGVGQVFLNDVEDTLEEIKWVKENLTGGIILPGDAPGGLVPLYSPKYDPIWELCADLGVPVHRHSNLPGEAVTEDNGPAGAAIGLIESSFFAHRGLAHLIFAGAFERFPGLKFVLTEGGAFWVPGYLAELDALYEGANQRGSLVNWFVGPAANRLERCPSEYFSSNCYVGASFLTPAEGTMRHEIGIDRIMWGSDLPHTEGTYPYTMEALRATFAQMPYSEAQQILADNASHVYGFDLVKLREISDQIGPLVSKVARPLTDEERPKTPEQTLTPALVPLPVPGFSTKSTEKIGVG